MGRSDHVDLSTNLDVAWTVCDNNLGAEKIQGTNAAVAHLLCGFSSTIGVHTRGGLQQEQKLGWESGRGDWPFLELAICNMYIFYDQSQIQTSYRVSSDKIISHVAKSRSVGYCSILPVGKQRTRLRDDTQTVTDRWRSRLLRSKASDSQD